MLNMLKKFKKSNNFSRELVSHEYSRMGNCSSVNRFNNRVNTAKERNSEVENRPKEKMQN